MSHEMYNHFLLVHAIVENTKFFVDLGTNPKSSQTKHQLSTHVHNLIDAEVLKRLSNNRKSNYKKKTPLEDPLTLITLYHVACMELILDWTDSNSDKKGRGETRGPKHNKTPV